VNTLLYTVGGNFLNSRLKHLQVWVNEEQYERLKREAEKRGLTVYSYVKQLLLKRKRMILLGYLLMVYSALSTFAIICIVLQLFAALP